LFYEVVATLGYFVLGYLGFASGLLDYLAAFGLEAP